MGVLTICLRVGRRSRRISDGALLPCGSCLVELSQPTEQKKERHVHQAVSVSLVQSYPFVQTFVFAALGFCKGIVIGIRNPVRNSSLGGYFSLKL